MTSPQAPVQDTTPARVPEFRFDRVPYVTLLLIASCVISYVVWQGGEPKSADQLNQLGAKNLSLMVECREWWRLLSANLLHASGWHLALNCLFLFNLGGPAEAAFKRRDYAFLLITSGLGAMLTSTFLGAATSCGVSGVLFGVWGALAVFGVRYRAHLPAKYQRYFLGSVLPYAAVAFYLGSMTPGVDASSHLGGALTGSLVALMLPPRWQPNGSFGLAKLAAVIGLLATIAAASWPRSAPPSPALTTMQLGALTVGLPDAWSLERQRDRQGRATLAATNRARVMASLTAWPTKPGSDAEHVARDFLEGDLLPTFAAQGAQLLELGEATPLSLNGLDAARVDLRLNANGYLTTTTLVFAVEGPNAHVLSLTTPAWLQPHYQPLLRKIALSLAPSSVASVALPADAASTAPVAP